VVARLELGGAQLSLLRVTLELARRGHRTRLLAGTATPAGVELARAHGVDPQVMGSGAELQWECVAGFAAWLAPRLEDAEVVHAHMLGAWWAAAEASPPGVPLVASEHNGYSRLDAMPWGAMADVASRIDRFYAHSPDARAGALRVGIPEGRIRLGVSPVEGMHAPPRGGLPSPRIVYAGRFSRDKGPDVLLDAVARMAAPPPVLMLGAGELEPELRAQAARSGLEDTVRFCGWVPEPARWVAGASVQACPSRHEAFSQTAVLAMGLGVPVVGTDVDGFPDTLAGGRGLVVAPEDPAALARALEDVLGGRRRTDTAAARAWARGFATSRVTDLYERGYEELLAPVGFAG